MLEEIYNKIYGDKKTSNFINKYFSTEKMLLTYPNLTIVLEDGRSKRVKSYYPEIRVFYYKFDVKRIM